MAQKNKNKNRFYGLPSPLSSRGAIELGKKRCYYDNFGAQEGQTCPKRTGNNPTAFLCCVLSDERCIQHQSRDHQPLTFLRHRHYAGNSQFVHMQKGGRLELILLIRGSALGPSSSSSLNVSVS